MKYARPTSKVLWCWFGVALIWSVVFVVRRHSDLSFQELQVAAGGLLESADELWASSESSEDQPQEAQADTSGDSVGSGTRPSTADKAPVKSWDVDSFKSVWLEKDLGEGFDGSRIEALCNSTTWRDDIVLQMVNSRGGLANVRATILDFLYFALHAGVRRIVLPSYLKRPDDTLNWMDDSLGYVPFDNLFDSAWLLAAMAQHCPQVAIYASPEDAGAAYEVSQVYEPPSSRGDKDLDAGLGKTIAHFNTWLAAGPPGYLPGAAAAAGVPTLVSTRAAMWTFDVYSRPGLRAALGRLVRVNPSIRSLAAAAVYSMRAGHGLEALVDPRDDFHRGAYYGMHLRTEQDATALVHWDEAYGGFDKQTDIHLQRCKELGLGLIYVASGNEEDIVRFAAKAREQANITVCSKRDLLTAPEDLAALEGLSWDQRGAIDWEVMARSSYYSGPAMVSRVFVFISTLSLLLSSPRNPLTKSYLIRLRNWLRTQDF